ncbi:hypothetical protein KG112_00070 [Nocardioides sp. zg-ZUI104]|uniref:hypothetical protein n=1 Tax=Nocardioides faecalis TaxID=2803858 RepID=UPI001BCD5937|nr:hypothetical protein [Nocardioides faecalis]MBS4751197.1 hypothetical protein [Nocardioides faecalis]
MRRPSRRRPRPVLPLAPGERLLAWASEAEPGGDVVGASREALYLPQRLGWEQVAAAEWDAETSTLRVVEVADFGAPAPVHLRRLAEAGRLLQLVRERVTASIVLQRHVPVADRSVRVLARRPLGAAAELSWFVEYDDGLDPADPAVAEVVDRALATARADVGV